MQWDKSERAFSVLMAGFAVAIVLTNIIGVKLFLAFPEAMPRGLFGEAVTLDESPLDPAILWVGFDDGNLQVSRDGGSTWSEVSRNVPGIANGTYVSRITASTAAPGVAYATFDAVWDAVHDRHFDPTFNGVDWDAVGAELRPLAGEAEDMDELREVLREMLGRLEQSHFSLVPKEAMSDERGEVAGDPDRVQQAPQVVARVAHDEHRARSRVRGAQLRI